MKTGYAAACALLTVTFLVTFLLWMETPASAHRLDEYLQATTISLEQGRIQAQMRLTPGVAVFPGVFASMDTNGDGVLSDAEQRAYAERALRDLSLMLDGNRLRLRPVSWKFAKVAEMKAGRGEIELDFTADVPRASRSRKLVFENHHQSRVAVYLVNCLVPTDPNIQVTAQKRNYLQSRYELDYTQANVSLSQASSSKRQGIPAGLITALLLLCAWLWRVRRTGAVQSIAGTPTKTASPKGRSV